MPKILNEPQNCILILDDENLFINQCDGTDIIINRSDIFKACIDPNFEKFGFNLPCQPTEKINFKVYELDSDLTFSEIFRSLLSDFDSMVLTQSQIIDFCERCRNLLKSNEHALLFLTKNNGQYFVINSDVFSDGYGAEIHPLDDLDVYMADDHYYIVLPNRLAC